MEVQETKLPDNPPTGEKAYLLKQADVKYDANGGAYNPRNQACSTCRWYNPTGYGGAQSCHLVLDYPEPIVSNGWCNRWEAKGNVREPMEVVIVTEVEDDTEDKQRKAVYISPQMNVLGKEEGAKTRFIPHRQTIFKDASGARLMYLVTSNGYQDRDGEFIKTSDLKTYVEKEWVADDAFLGTNVHLFWHDRNLVMGDIIWANMEGEFLTEVSRERLGDPVVKAIWDYVEANPDALEWGTSHGFYYQRRDTDGVYHGVRKFESSTLPLNAAANLLTLSEVIPMSQKDKTLDKIFNYQGAAQVLRNQGVEALRKQLTDAGLVSKDAAGTSNQPVMQPEVASLLTDIIVAQDAIQKELDALKAANSNKAAGSQVDLSPLDLRLARIEKALEMPASPASSSPQTVIKQSEGAAVDTEVLKALEALMSKSKDGSDRPFEGMGLYKDETQP